MLKLRQLSSQVTVFVITMSSALGLQAMNYKPTVAPTRPSSLKDFLQADPAAIEPQLDRFFNLFSLPKNKEYYRQHMLMEAARAEKDKTNSPAKIRLIIQLLLDRGADPLKPDKFEATAFSQSCFISSYPIIKNIIFRLMMGTLDPNDCPTPKAAPLLWHIVERATKYPVYRLAQAALECDANPDILSEKEDSLLDRLLSRKEQFIDAKRYSEYDMLIRLLLRFGATTNHINFHDYFKPEEVEELQHERSIYLADEAFLMAAYTPAQYPTLSQKPLGELYVLKLQAFSPVQTPTPLVKIIADYSDNNSFVIKR